MSIMPFRFNIFDLYLFIIHKVTLYCPPINRERFEKEFANRYRRANELNPRSKNHHSSRKCTPYRGGSQLLWIIIHPIKVFQLVRDYHMVSSVNLILQLIHSLFIFHIFLKSVIHTTLYGSGKQTLEGYESIYYPNLTGVTQAPYIFNYLLLGYSSFFLFVKIFRFRDAINISLKNAYEYRDLKVAQLNSAYLATFYLSFEEWISLWKYTREHQKFVHSNKATEVDHLRFNKLIQQILPALSDRDALFFVNPIDFDICYADSVLPNYHVRRMRYKHWHIPSPIDRTSVNELKEILLVTVLGSSSLWIGYIIAIIIIIYLELKSEFTSDHSPSLGELFHVMPLHWANLLHCIRFAEFVLLFTTAIFMIYDLVCAFLDVQNITNRTHKMNRRFENYLEFFRHQARGWDQNSETTKTPRLKKDHFILLRRSFKRERKTVEDPNIEYNRLIRYDVILVRLLYREFLVARKHHTEYLNIFVIGAGCCSAYMIPVVISQPISAETLITLAALLSSFIPIVFIFLVCARMERAVCFPLPIACNSNYDAFTGSF